MAPELCYRLALANPNVHVLMTCPGNREQLKQNFAALQLGPLIPEELNWIMEYGRLVKY